MRAVEQRRVIAGIVGQANRRGVRPRTDEVAPPQFSRIDVHLARRRLHDAFKHIGRFGTSCAAISIDGNRVREDRLHLGVDRGRGVLAGEQRGVQDGRNRGRERRQIRAHVRRRVHAQAEELAVGVHREFGFGDVIAAVCIGEKCFRALARPLDRPPDFLRRPRQRHIFRIQINLRAEAAAHVRRDDPQFRFRQRQHERRHQQTLDVRILVRDVDRVAVVGLRITRVHGARFDRVRHQALIHDIQRGHVRGLREGGVGGGFIAVAPGVAEVVRRFIVDLRLAGVRLRWRYRRTAGSTS